MSKTSFDISAFHADTIRNFSRVADICVGLVGNEWLPGELRTFNAAVRRPGEATRPLALNLEVTQNGGLWLSWATAHPVNGRLVFQTRGKVDFRAPIVSGARGPQLNLDRPKHRLNCKLGCDILRRIADVGYAILRGETPRIDDPRWPKLFMSFQPGHEVIDNDKLTALAMQHAPVELLEQYRNALYKDLVHMDGKLLRVSAAILPDELLTDGISNNMVVEDYSPVLGALDRPLEVDRVSDVQISVPNPAAKILARHGIADVEGVNQHQLDELATEFRAELAEYELTEDDVYGAFLDPQAAVDVSIDIKTAILRMPSLAAAKLRTVASGRAQREATDQELLAAALSPGQPVVLNRLSKIQVATTDMWEESMPSWYAGDFLAPVDWMPAHRAAKDVAAVETEV